MAQRNGGMKRRGDILIRFGTRVRELRMQTGLSQEAFAAKCGLDRTYVSGIERGRRNLSLRNIAKIAEFLGISLSELTEGV
jgi:transcriptional regulator with XRE-family HTH domain